jgi:hypothetical protein
MNKATLFWLDLLAMLWATGAYISAVLWLTSLVLKTVDLGYHTVCSSEQYFICMIGNYLISSVFTYVRQKVT